MSDAPVHPPLAAGPSPGRRTERPGAPRPARWWLAGVTALVGGLLLGWFVTAKGPTATGEYALDVWLGEHHDSPLNALSAIVDIVSGPVAAPIVMLAVAGLAWRRSRAAALTVLAATAVGWLSVGVGKILFHRERPPMQVVHALSFEGAADSFPSGHVAFATALLLGVVLAWRVMRRPTRRAWLLGIPAILIDGAMRLYAGAHYLGDVLAASLFAAGSVGCLVALWWSLPQAWRFSIHRRLAPRVIG